MPDPAPLRRASALTRVLDTGYASNRFALFIGVFAFLVRLVAGVTVGDAAASEALGSAVSAGAGVFLAWAIARELDPDHTRTARYAGFGAVVLLSLGPPDLAALFAVLVATRVVTRPTGRRPQTLDLVGIVVLGWLTGNDPTGVVAGFALAASLVWDTRLPERAPSSSGLVAASTLTTTVVAALVGGTLFVGWDGPSLPEIGVFLLGVAASTRITVDAVATRADATGELLHPRRVWAGRVLVGATLAGTLVWVGGPAVGALAGAWAAFVATALVRWRSSRLAPVVALIATVTAAGAPTQAPSESRPAPVAAPSPSPEPTTEPSPSPTASPTPDPPPAVRAHDSPEALATDVVAAERAIRDPLTPAAHLDGWAHVQQAAYRELAEQPGWTERVRPLVPEELRAAFDLNAQAQAQLHALTTPREQLPDHWTIVAPPPADELLAAYRTAAAEFGIDWTYLAAIHLIETRMGRIRGDSTAGARGPMQFLPSTWEAYGEGDIEDPTDAIRAAARYLVAHGAPDRMHDALWAYNHSDRYVTAVSNYAHVMRAEPATYHAYHAWRVYYRLTTGSVVLEEGWSAAP